MDLGTSIDLTAVSSSDLLGVAERNVVVRRNVEVERLLVVLEWCDRNGDDPQALPGAVPASKGGDRLIALGGDGTPQVAELCFPELAIAFRTGAVSIRNLAADALDLRHRLPRLYAALLAGRCELWLARKVASTSRLLDKNRVGIVDVAVTSALDESPGRVLAVAEAKVIEADPEAHRARITEDDAKTGVWLSRRRAGDAIDPTDGEPGTRRINAKLPHGAAIEIDAMIDDLADALARHTEPDENGDKPTRGQLRAQAFELLAQPHAAARFLDGLTDADPDDAEKRPPRRRPAVLNIHLSGWALHALGLDAIARVDDIGPLLLSQLQELLQRRDVTLRPVIDLNAVQAVTAYEHPTLMAERVTLRHQGDAFPHATSSPNARVDLDHAQPYVAGRTGQTSDRNTTPLTRSSHRTKTFRGYQVKQLGLAAHRWTTPNGLARVVTPHGTTKVELIKARDGTGNDHVLGELYDSRIMVDFCPQDTSRDGFSTGGQSADGDVPD